MAAAETHRTELKATEVCREANIAPYVLRYWVTEFPFLSANKDKGASRTFTQRELRVIARIRELLYDEGFTIAGAKKRIEAEISGGSFDEAGKGKPAPIPKPPAAPVPPAAKTAAAAKVEAAPPAKVAAAPAPAARSSEPSPAETRKKAELVRELKHIHDMLGNSRKR